MATTNNQPYYGEIYDSKGNLVGFGILGLPWSKTPEKKEKKRG